jgi:hypothetical protein
MSILFILELFIYCLINEQECFNMFKATYERVARVAYLDLIKYDLRVY